MLNDYPDVLTVEQLSEILGIGINAAYRLVNDGTIGCRRIGKTIRIPKVCVTDYINAARFTVKPITADELLKGEQHDRKSAN